MVSTATSGAIPTLTAVGRIHFLLHRTEVRKWKYHSVWLQEMRKSCKSVFPNTHVWECERFKIVQAKLNAIAKLVLCDAIR